MAYRAKDRAPQRPSQPSTLETREPGLRFQVRSSQLLLSSGQARMSPPGFPGVHPLSATGQSPKMGVPAPALGSCGFCSQGFTGTGMRDGRRLFLGGLLVPGTRPAWRVLTAA